MPQIASLPIDEPVAKPHASPQEFGSVGETIAGLGYETQQMAIGNLEFEQHLIVAQRQLRAKEAEIAHARVLSQVHADIAKASTPEEVDAIQAQARGELHRAIEPYRQHDHLLGRQLDIFAQQQDVELQNTVNAKKADIISTSDKAANEVKKRSTINESINLRVAGGDWTAARAQYELWLHSSANAKTMPPEVIEKLMQDWDEEHEAGYIEAQLHSLNLQTVQDTVNDLRLHPEKYPHLNKGELNALADKGDSEVVSRLSRQDAINARTEQQQYWNNSPTGIPALFTDGNGNFDEAGALKYVTSKHLSPDGEKTLIDNVKTHGAAANFQLKKDATKIENDIVKALSNRDYKGADDMLDKYKAFTEQHPEFGDAYKALKTYEYAQQEHARSEALYARGVHNEEVRMKRDQEQYDSFDLLGQLGPAIQRGEYSDTQLRAMAGKGKGKLLPPQVEEAIRLSHSIETDPENKPYINSIWNDTAIPTAAQGEVITEFHDFLRKHPQASGTEKAAEVKRLTDPAKIEQINKSIDDLNDKLNGVGQSAPNIPAGDISLPEDYAGGVPEPTRPTGVPANAVWNPKAQQWQIQRR